uniref:SFRICE_009374 n=1 Tax=Spodoptera frugiperda TaxID=7108 RepID=A0A2H1V175_SPOFR
MLTEVVWYKPVKEQTDHLLKKKNKFVNSTNNNTSIPLHNYMPTLHKAPNIRHLAQAIGTQYGRLILQLTTRAIGGVQMDSTCRLSTKLDGFWKFLVRLERSRLYILD